MSSFWVEWVDGKEGCLEGKDQVSVLAAAVALNNSGVKSVMTLPYPAEPRLGEPSGVPSFCIEPGRCKGRSSCPRSYSCTE